MEERKNKGFGLKGIVLTTALVATCFFPGKQKAPEMPVYKSPPKILQDTKDTSIPESVYQVLEPNDPRLGNIGNEQLTPEDLRNILYHKFFR